MFGYVARHVWRQCRHDLRGASITGLALALGLSLASSAIWLYLVVTRPLPFKDPQELVSVAGVPIERSGELIRLQADYLNLPEFTVLGIVGTGAANLQTGATADRVVVGIADHALFQALGVRAAVGRTFSAAESRGARVVALAFTQWTRLGKPALSQLSVRVNGRLFEVVGVMPEAFAFPQGSQAWIPPGSDPQAGGDVFAPKVVGRLAAGITRANVVARLNQVRRATRGGPVGAPNSVVVTPLTDGNSSDLRPLSQMLAVLMVIVMVATCVNLGFIAMTRLAAGTSQRAIQRSLGIPPWLSLWQAAAEPIPMVVASIAFGAVGAIGLSRLLVQFLREAAGFQPAGAQIIQTVFVAGAIGGLAALLICVVPAALVWKSEYRQHQIRAMARPRQRRAVRRALVVVHIAVAFVAALMAFSVQLTSPHLVDRDRSEDGAARHTLLFELILPRVRYPSAVDVQRLLATVGSEAVKIAPGIALAARDAFDARTGVTRSDTVSIDLQGATRSAVASRHVASPQYFAIAGGRLVAGREFEVADTADSRSVVMINAALAAALVPNAASAVGATLRIGDETAEVVGVVSEAASSVRSADSRAYYRPLLQAPPSASLDVAATSGLSPGLLETTLRERLGAVDPGLSLYRVRTLHEQAVQWEMPRRSLVVLLSGFALSTVTLAGLGLFAFLTQRSQYQSRDIAIRLALGASVRTLRLEVVKTGVSLSAAGLAAGWLCLQGLIRILGAAWRELPSPPLAAVLGTGLLILLVSVSCAHAPTRRVANLDPSRSLGPDSLD